MCWKAALLIAACLGYLPSEGTSVVVSKSCVDRFSPARRAAAIRCAAEHRVDYTVRKN